MSTGYSNRVFNCPYFQYDQRTRVHCEGGTISMPDRVSFIRWVNKYCCDVPNWEKCPIAQHLTEYYERILANEERR